MNQKDSLSAQDLLLRILSLIADRDRVSVGDVVREFGVSRSGAYRALRTLERNDYLLLSPSGRGYGPGPALVRLSELPPIDIAGRRAWGPVLDAIRDATGETVHVAALVGSQVLVIDGRRSSHEHDMGSRIGMTASANAMAGGKLLLAALDDRLVRAVVPASTLPQRTSRTIADVDALIAELASIRLDGFACAIQESEAGIDSIAIPLDGSSMSTRVAAVISVPSARGGIRRLRRLGVLASHAIAQAADSGRVTPWRLKPARRKSA